MLGDIEFPLGVYCIEVHACLWDIAKDNFREANLRTKTSGKLEHSQDTWDYFHQRNNKPVLEIRAPEF